VYGEHADTVYGYQFGLAFLWTPFYGIGKALAAIGLDTVGPEPTRTATIAIVTALTVLVIGALLVPVIRALDLSHAGAALLLALFGSPLFFYATFQPGLSHVADTLALTAMLALVFRLLRAPSPSTTVAVAIGVIGGLATTVRFFNVFELIAIAGCVFLYGRRREAISMVVAGAAAFAVLAPIPFALGADSLISGYSEQLNTLGRSTHSFELQPQNPFLMLFDPWAGLFPWAPLTLVALGGYVVLVRRRPDARPFLVVAAAAALAIIVPYVGLSFWDGESRFANRYLTALYPLVVLGLAMLLELRTRLVAVVSVLCCAWSVALSFNAIVGIPEQTDAFELSRRLGDGRITPAEWTDAVYHRSRIVNAVLPDPVNHG
jgi:hypothetical protein